MKNIKLFEEFVAEAASMGELKRFAKNFKQDWFDMEEGSGSEEEIMASWENITGYLGGDQLVTISPDGETSPEFNSLVASLKGKKAIEDYHSGEAYYAKLNGVNVVATYDPGISTFQQIYVNIKDAKKFDLTTTPFVG